MRQDRPGRQLTCISRPHHLRTTQKGSRGAPGVWVAAVAHGVLATVCSRTRMGPAGCEAMGAYHRLITERKDRFDKA